MLGFFILLTYGEIFSDPPTANINIDNVVKYEKLKLGTNFLILKSTVAGCIPLMAGAASINTTYNNDITNTDVPAMVPITFKEVIPLDAIHKNNKNTAKVNN